MDGVYEVTVTVTDELTDLLFLVVDLFASCRFSVSDLGNGLRGEERPNIPVACSGNSEVMTEGFRW